MLVSVKGWTPRIHPSAFIAGGVYVIGDVSVAEDVSVWFNSVIRADTAPIAIGSRSNIQDRCLIHSDEGQPTTIGRNVVMGHGAVVHAATIEDAVLVGIGAVVLNRAVVGEGSIIGAGALVVADMVVPPRSLVVGAPGKIVRRLSEKEVEATLAMADRYVVKAGQYKASGRVLPELERA